VIVTVDDKTLLVETLRTLEDGKAGDPTVLDLRKLTTMADYFVIAHGTNVRQVQALGREVQESLAGHLGIKPHHVEGLTQGQWVLMDYGHIIIHLFLEEKRGYYSLERIWMDAPRVQP
jgi:ribosome-associated protein